MVPLNCMGIRIEDVPEPRQKGVSRWFKTAELREVSHEPARVLDEGGLPFRKDIDDLLSHNQGVVVENVVHSNVAFRDGNFLVKECLSKG